jgi:hypothetical protein
MHRAEATRVSAQHVLSLSLCFERPLAQNVLCQEMKEAT